MSIIIHSAGIPVVNKAGTVTRKIGVSLSAPATVSLSAASRDGKFTISGALSFTPSNYSIPQALTLTGVNDAVNDDLLIDQLQITGTGQTQKNIDVAVIDESDAARGFRGTRWIDEAKITSLSDVATLRTSLIAQIFNGNGLPTNAVPAATTSAYTGQMHCTNTSQISGYSSVDKLTWTWVDGQGATWTYYAYHIKASTSVNKIAYIDEGHVLEGFVDLNEYLLINSLLSEGWDVVSLAMPVAGDNTEANANIDSSSSTITVRHNQILSKRLDNSTYNAYELFLCAHFMTHNYILANYNFTKHVTIGASGGSIMATWLPALIDTIDMTWINRGIVIRSLFATDTFGDFEGGGIRDSWRSCGLRIWNMFEEVEQVDRLVMACSNGRHAIVIQKNGDTALVTAQGWNNLVWRDKLSELGTRVSGTLTMYVNNGGSDTAHAWHQSDIDSYVIPNLP